MKNTFKALENTEKISSMKISGLTTYYCEIGKDFTITEYEIGIVLGDKIPEYNSFSEYMNAYGEFRGSREKFISTLKKDVTEILQPKDIYIETKNLGRDATFKVSI